MGRIELLHQQRKIKPGRPPADTDDAH
jgi:hypothetical protein